MVFAFPSSGVFWRTGDKEFPASSLGGIGNAHACGHILFYKALLSLGAGEREAKAKEMGSLWIYEMEQCLKAISRNS
jgi:hypothetical protein